MPENIAVVIENYKSFKRPGSKIDDVYPINLVIGKNNTGKSAFLEVIRYLATPPNDNRNLDVFLDRAISESHITKAVPDNVSGGPIPGQHRTHCMSFVGRVARFRVLHNGQLQIQPLDIGFPDIYRQELERAIQNDPFVLRRQAVRTISAERNVQPEQASNQVGVRSSGEGVTNVIQYVLNEVGQDRSLVEVEMLRELNNIMDDEARFTRIQTRIDSNSQRWEIFLNEDSKGEIALSASGSGLKTIIQVLVEFLLMPILTSTPPGLNIYLLEELENNLHPGIQRRLLDFIQRRLVGSGDVVFLATHSSVFLDALASDEDAQILHVTQNSGVSDIVRVLDRRGLHGTLDDLDVRASDLLQTNGVIWVEGPSDRIYLRRLIDITSDNTLKEGRQYQILIYGGRILSHFTTEEESDAMIDILLTNRNAALVMDRDTEVLNDTKMRIVREFENLNLLHYVTYRKELECDLSNQAVARIHPELNGILPNDLESFDEYLERSHVLSGSAYKSSKVDFAKLLSDEMTASDLATSDPLMSFVHELCDVIRAWQ